MIKIKADVKSHFCAAHNRHLYVYQIQLLGAKTIYKYGTKLTVINQKYIKHG